LQEASGREDYRPRLSVEVGDLGVEAESKAEGVTAKLKVYRLEAVEHLPTSASCDSLSAVILGEVRGCLAHSGELWGPAGHMLKLVSVCLGEWVAGMSSYRASSVEKSVM